MHEKNSLFAQNAMEYCSRANTQSTQLFFRSIFMVFVSIPHLSKKLIICSFYQLQTNFWDVLEQKSIFSNDSNLFYSNIFYEF